jgi:tetratricopeptide (TPR) repeat protein
MNTGMRHVIGGAALVAGILLQAAPAFAQAPPWARQDQRRYYAPPPRGMHPAQQRPQMHPQQAQPQQARPQQPQQQAQPQPKPPRPEPIQNVQERATCLNKETPQTVLIAACTVVLDADKEKPALRAALLFNRGEAYREKGDLDNAIKDLGESIDLDGKNAAVFFSRATALRAKGGQADAAIADYDQAIRLDGKNPSYYSTRSHAY